MTDKSIDNYLASLEREFADELDCILFYDLSDYTTDYLYELKQKASIRKILHQTIFKKLVWLGASSPIWLLIGIIATFTTDNIWLPKIALLFPVAIFLFIYGLFRLHQRLGGLQKQEYISRLIEIEINRRNRHSFPNVNYRLK